MKSRISIALLAATALAASVPLRAQAPAHLMGAPYHDASRAYIDVMIPHHEDVIMMTEHHLAMAKSEAVKTLARRMMAGERQEVAELKATRRSLFGSDSSRSSMMRGMMQMTGMDHMRDTGAMRAHMDSMRMHEHAMAGAQRAAMPRAAMPHEPMSGMPMGGMMSGDMDRMFLQHMIAHYQDGIDLSILAEDSRAAAQVRELARRSREAHERDIAEMRRLLTTLPAAATDGASH